MHLSIKHAGPTTVLVFSLCGLLYIGLSACSSGPPPAPELKTISQPKQLLQLGTTDFAEGDYKQARYHFKAALEKYRAIDDQAGTLESFFNLAKTCLAYNDTDCAAANITRADNILQHDNNLKSTDYPVYLDLLKSSLAIKTGQYARATDLLQPALDQNNQRYRLAALKNRTAIAFKTDAEDREQWLSQYQQLQATVNDSPAHKARILRFKAELDAEPLQSEQYLQQSLAISKTLADKPAIAAALEQWGDNERDAQQYNDAENRYLRALYIRHALGDITTTKNLLSKLSEIYQLEKNSVHNAELTDKAKAANRWIEKIDNHDLTGWQDMMQAFD